MIVADIYYRDITILQGEDTVFVASGVFRGLHGYQRETGAKLVVVPFVRDNETSRMVKPGELPTSFRVFSDSRDTLDGIDLRGPIEDAVKLRRVKLCEGAGGTPAINVRRVRCVTNSDIARAERRGRPEEHIGKMKNRLVARPKAGDVFFWMQKGTVKYPLFLDITVCEKGSTDFVSTNSYGCGIAPFVDFSN